MSKGCERDGKYHVWEIPRSPFMAKQCIYKKMWGKLWRNQIVKGPGLPWGTGFSAVGKDWYTINSVQKRILEVHTPRGGHFGVGEHGGRETSYKPISVIQVEVAKGLK